MRETTPSTSSSIVSAWREPLPPRPTFPTLQEVVRDARAAEETAATHALETRTRRASADLHLFEGLFGGNPHALLAEVSRAPVRYPQGTLPLLEDLVGRRRTLDDLTEGEFRLLAAITLEALTALEEREKAPQKPPTPTRAKTAAHDAPERPSPFSPAPLLAPIDDTGRRAFWWVDRGGGGGEDPTPSGVDDAGFSSQESRPSHRRR